MYIYPMIPFLLQKPHAEFSFKRARAIWDPSIGSVYNLSYEGQVIKSSSGGRSWSVFLRCLINAVTHGDVSKSTGAWISSRSADTSRGGGGGRASRQCRSLFVEWACNASLTPISIHPSIRCCRVQTRAVCYIWMINSAYLPQVLSPYLCTNISHVWRSTFLSLVTLLANNITPKR